MPATELNAVVALRIEISPWLIILRVAPRGWSLPEFQPGQFAVLGLPGSASRSALADPDDPPLADPSKLIRRAYSISSSSVTCEYMEFYIALVGSGALTPRLFNLHIGDSLFLGPKITGLFTFDQVPPDANVVMIATGTGLAPYMSMLSTHLMCGSPRRLAVLHGARHSWDLGYRSELLTLQHLCANFAYLPIVSRPQDEPVTWPGRTGYVQELWKMGALAKHWGMVPTPQNTHIFLCGSPGMIDDTVAMLAAEGFREQTRKEKGEIHVERYW
jgi:ferredoxin/flavodoxin---NADP+ reductase